MPLKHVKCRTLGEDGQTPKCVLAQVYPMPTALVWLQPVRDQTISRYSQFDSSSPAALSLICNRSNSQENEKITYTGVCHDLLHCHLGDGMVRVKLGFLSQMSPSLVYL